MPVIHAGHYVSVSYVIASIDIYRFGFWIHPQVVDIIADCHRGKLL